MSIGVGEVSVGVCEGWGLVVVLQGMKVLWASGCGALLGDILCGIGLARAFM